MQNSENKFLDKVSVKLLSVSPLIHRGIRRKLVMTTLASANLPITPLHLEIMSLLDESEEHSITQIVKSLNITKAQMTHLVDRLVELEMAERCTNANDRRIVNITLTKTGKDFIQRHVSKLKAAAKEALSCLSEEELKNLDGSLDSIQKILAKTL